MQNKVEVQNRLFVQFQGEMSCKRSVLTAFVPKKPVAMSVGSIYIDQSVVGNA